MQADGNRIVVEIYADSIVLDTNHVQVSLQNEGRIALATGGGSPTEQKVSDAVFAAGYVLLCRPLFDPDTYFLFLFRTMGNAGDLFK
jgi:hypothetical protein